METSYHCRKNSKGLIEDSKYFSADTIVERGLKNDFCIWKYIDFTASNVVFKQQLYLYLIYRDAITHLN